MNITQAEYESIKNAYDIIKKLCESTDCCRCPIDRVCDGALSVRYYIETASENLKKLISKPEKGGEKMVTDKTLIVVDMQRDFINGSLGTKEAESILENVKKKIDEYVDRGHKVIFTRDTHQSDYLQTNEGKNLPVEHCIQGTKGWDIDERLYCEGATVINKPTFGYTEWQNFDFEEVELVGLCTDICVISNALIIKAMFPEIDVTVDASCCAGVTPETHQAALTTMKSCQIKVIGE